MNDNYLENRINDILHEKIAMGGEGKQHRYLNDTCSRKKIKRGIAPYWKEYHKDGSEDCWQYPYYLEEKARRYRERENVGSGCMNCPCAAGVLINSARYGGYGTRKGALKAAAKNPWIQCIKKRAKLYKQGKGCGFGGIESHMEYVEAAAKNPWLQFLHEFRMEHPEYQHIPQNELVKIARPFYYAEKRSYRR
jgi:hypothetical protein